MIVEYVLWFQATVSASQAHRGQIRECISALPALHLPPCKTLLNSDWEVSLPIHVKTN